MYPLTHCDCNETDSVNKYNFVVLPIMTCKGCADSFSCESILAHILTKINLLYWLLHCSIRQDTLCRSANPKVRHQHQKSALLDAFVIHINPFNLLLTPHFFSIVALIISSHPSLRLQSCPLPSGFPMKNMCSFLAFSTRAILKNVRKQINSIKLRNKKK